MALACTAGRVSCSHQALSASSGRATARGARPRRPLRVQATTDYEALEKHTVYSLEGKAVKLTSEWTANPGQRCVVAFLTHFADLSSTEFAQKLLPVLPELQAAGVGVLAVGLGEPEKAKKFAELLNFPPGLLYADPTGALYTELGFNRGFAPETNISAYAKLLAMLAGVGSPGTIQEVLRGYVGDRSAKPVFSAGSSGGAGNLFDVLGTGYQRPFELATLRLYNMQLVLSNWSALAPSDERLLTQQGGCIGFDGKEVIFRHADEGILKYANVEKLVEDMLPGGTARAAPPTQVLRTLL